MLLSGLEQEVLKQSSVGGDPTWFRRYRDGASFEIYPAVFSPSFDGVCFARVAAFAFRRYRICVFAIAHFAPNGDFLVLLNPGHAHTVQKDDVAFVLASDSIDAALLTSPVDAAELGFCVQCGSGAAGAGAASVVGSGVGDIGRDEPSSSSGATKDGAHVVNISAAALVRASAASDKPAQSPAFSLNALFVNPNESSSAEPVHAASVEIEMVQSPPTKSHGILKAHAPSAAVATRSASASPSLAVAVTSPTSSTCSISQVQTEFVDSNPITLPKFQISPITPTKSSLALPKQSIR